MSAFGNPKIVDDGLVFMYDANNKKSFRGEPTTLYGDPFPSGSSLPSGFHWSYEYDNQVVDAPIQGHFLSKEKWVKSTRDTTGSRRVLFINNSFVTGKTYTFSCYAYSTDTNLTSLAHVSHNSGYSVRTDYTEYANADLGTVKRIHGTWVQQVNGGPIFGMQTNNADLGTTFYMTGFQVEEKSSATQLARITRGSRSTTQALKDRTGNSTIDVSTASFDSNSQLTFDGTDDYISIDSVAPLIAGGDFSLEALIKGPTQDHKSIISINTSGGANRALFMVRSASMGIFDGGTWYIGNIDVDDNKWHHVVLSYTRSTKNAVIYVDGEVSKNATTGNQITVSSSDKVSIGMEYDGSSVTDVFNGKIAVAKVYNKALTAAEVTRNFKARRSRFGL